MSAETDPSDPPPSGDPAERGEGASSIASLVERARRAQADWATAAIAERIRAVAKVKHRLLARVEEIGDLLHDECGKPATEAILSEVVPSADVFDYWIGSIEEHLAPTEIELSAVAYPGKTARSYRSPRGVIALVTPSNYPVAIPLRTIVPALLAGNAVVWKPSEIGARAARVVASAFDGVVPEGVLSLALGGADAGRALVGSRVDLVVFTGGVAAGRKVLAACAERLVPASVELGGKDAAIVLADAKLERAARGIVWGAFTNAGQNCASIERVYADKKIASALEKRIVELVRDLDPERDLGRLATEAQAAIVKRHVEGAVAKGAELLAGGPPEGDDIRRFTAKVVKIANEEVELLTEETFGPVLPIVVVDGPEEAAARVRASRFGLTTSIWTRSPERAAHLVDAVGTPVVTFNCHGISAAIPEAPWTGVGESGFGVTNGPYALAELTRPRVVLEDTSSASTELYWYPYTPALRTLAVSLAMLRGGASFLGKLPAFFTFLGALVRRLLEGGKTSGSRTDK